MSQATTTAKAAAQRIRRGTETADLGLVLYEFAIALEGIERQLAALEKRPPSTRPD